MTNPALVSDTIDVPVSRDENIAAVVYVIAFHVDTAGEPLFYGRYGDELEGQIGCLRYLISAADQLTKAEEAEPAAYDWYLAVNDFVAAIIGAILLPSEQELYAMAQKAIAENKEGL